MYVYALRPVCLCRPITPADMDWMPYFPAMELEQHVQFLDVGCGYGGMLSKLNPVEMFGVWGVRAFTTRSMLQSGH